LANQGPIPIFMIYLNVCTKKKKNSGNLLVVIVYNIKIIFGSSVS